MQLFVAQSALLLEWRKGELLFCLFTGSVYLRAISLQTTIPEIIQGYGFVSAVCCNRMNITYAIRPVKINHVSAKNHQFFHLCAIIT